MPECFARSLSDIAGCRGVGQKCSRRRIQRCQALAGRSTGKRVVPAGVKYHDVHAIACAFERIDSRIHVDGLIRRVSLCG